MDVTYPLFVFEKDCQSVQIIEDPSRIGILEAIDIVNDEYVFRDANGNDVSVAASVTAFTSKIGDVTSSDSLFPLRDAFTLYAKTLGLPDFDANGTPREVWDRILKELAARPKKPNFLARLFR
jgi:hypothetical protein